MGYKFLGFVVWQGVKLYLRRRNSGRRRRKLAIAGLSAAVVAGVVAVGRQQASRNAQPKAH
jgi:hypothetical protein